MSEATGESQQTEEQVLKFDNGVVRRTAISYFIEMAEEDSEAEVLSLEEAEERELL